METIYLNANDDGVQELARLTFPAYTGKKFQMCPLNGPIRLHNYWSDGSRSYWSFIRIEDMHAVELPYSTLGNPAHKDAHQECEIPHGFIAVEHVIFCGKDMGLRFHVHAENVTKYLPLKQEITWAEMVVLSATRSLKPSYGGIKNFRYHSAHERTRITEEEWNTAKASLSEKGLVDKRGAITTDGRNIIGMKDLYHLQREDQ